MSGGRYYYSHQRRRHRDDVVRCPDCRDELLQEVTREGYAALHCAACHTTEIVYPRRIEPLPEAPTARQLWVTDTCAMCGRPIETAIRRGAGERVTVCDSHTTDERAKWAVRWDGRCVVAGCVALATSRGRCGRHYARWWREATRHTRAAMEAAGQGPP